MIDKSVKMFGVTEIGPLHKKERLPNADAWLGWRKKGNHLIVVCDGLGSCPKSHIGAKAACLAIRDAVNIWIGRGTKRPTDLLRMITPIWLTYLPTDHFEDYKTTCLFALSMNDGTLIIAGLGDGLAGVVLPGTQMTCVIGNRHNEFINQTASLGMEKSGHFWKMKVYEKVDSFRAFLATDGISDDIVPERMDGFVAWLIDDFSDLLPRQRRYMLSKELKNWPTPNHSDDKTLAIMWKDQG